MPSVDPLARSSGTNYSRSFGTGHSHQPVDVDRERRIRARRQLDARDQHELRQARATATVDRLLSRGHRDRQSHGEPRECVPNEQLAQALVAAGVTPRELAKKVGVDPKTIERWITKGRMPYPNHQHAVAEAVGVDRAQLWPARQNGTSAPSEPRSLNHRLRQAIFDARLTPEKLAENLGLSTKTIERWITKGLVPYSCNQAAVAVEVGVPEWELWPVTPQQQTPVQDTPAPPPTREHRDDTSRQADAEHSPLSDPDRMRALMSWIDSTTPVRERDIRANPDQYTGPMVDTPAPAHHRAPRDPDFGRRRRSDGLEHTR